MLVGVDPGAGEQLRVEFGVGPLGDGLVIVRFDLHSCTCFK